jgi:hypothetical protein
MMGDKQGYLVYADNHQVQRSLETKGLSGFLNEMSVSRQEELLNAVISPFLTGSSKKCQFFMDFKYIDYATLQRGLNYRLPAYGVKGGIAGLTRATNYVQVMLTKEKDLSGQDFNATVFGGDYLQSEEVTGFSAGMLAEAISRSGRKISNNISPNDRTKICCLAENVWHFQEINPRTRLVVLLENAEKRSGEILRQLYLLFPQKLRLQLGFETNIARGDLDAIDNAGGLPIYILTMEKREYRELSGYSFPVEVVDFDTLDEVDCDSERLKLLMALARDMSELNAGLFDHAEKKVIEGKEGNVSSFKYYGEIVERMTTGELFWWTNRKIDSVEQLKAMYDDQIYLMKVTKLKEEAIRTFYTEIYPNTNLGRQVTQIAIDKSYKNRQELLTFLSDELYLKPQIEAAQSLKNALERQSEEVLENLKEASSRQIRAERDKVAREFEERVTEAERSAKSNAERADRLQNELDSARKEMQTVREGAGGLGYDGETSEDRSSLKRANNKAKTAEKKAQRFQIATIVMGILFAAAAIFAILNVMNAGKVQSQLAAEQARYVEVQGHLAEKTSENSALQEQVEALTAERDRLAEEVTGPVSENTEQSYAEPDMPNETETEVSEEAMPEESVNSEVTASGESNPETYAESEVVTGETENQE